MGLAAEIILTLLAVVACAWVGVMAPPASLLGRLALRTLAAGSMLWLFICVIVANQPHL